MVFMFLSEICLYDYILFGNIILYPNMDEERILTSLTDYRWQTVDTATCQNHFTKH